MPGLSATAAKSCVGQGYFAPIQVSFHRLKTPSAAPTVPPLEPSQGVIDDSRPLGVYVHFPFCGSRCPYCDFAVAVRSEIPHDAYADSVLSELSVRAPWWKGESGPNLASIYFGGGTPGLWRPDALGRVLLGARQAFAGNAELEITVEANPGDLDGANLRDLRALGVNRLSFGAQAFQNSLLQRIGRRHDASAIPRAFEAARAAGFDNLCADLMFGLPGQTMDDWRASLAALCALAPEHITAYALTVEPGTRFGALDRAGKLDRPEEDVVAAMYTTCDEVLTAAGFEHYEISSYARPGRRSVHNSLYWTMGAYLGLGASASSFRPLTGGEGWRFSNSRSVSTYLRDVHTFTGAVPPEQVELRSPTQLEDEALWLGLRMSDGVDRYAHKRRHGHDPLALPERAAAANACAAAGWLEVTPERLRLLPAGFLFADEVAVRLGRRDR
jgi:oxygen-independent coproporphyrinogen-3 oxidase